LACPVVIVTGSGETLLLLAAKTGRAVMAVIPKAIQAACTLLFITFSPFGDKIFQLLGMISIFTFIEIKIKKQEMLMKSIKY
jgi:hypothetical protein